MGAATRKAIELTESGLIPDSVIRRGIRSLLGRRPEASDADDIGAAAAFRMERDPVLAKAVELLRASEDQMALFDAAASAKAARERAAAGGATGSDDTGSDGQH